MTLSFELNSQRASKNWGFAIHPPIFSKFLTLLIWEKASVEKSKIFQHKSKKIKDFFTIRAKESLYKGQRLGCYMGEIKHNAEPSKDWRYNFAYVQS